MNKDKYDKIHEGMAYQEVVAIIGTNGEEQGSNKIEGIPGVIPSVNTKGYEWRNHDGSGMSAMFPNDRLMQKIQYKLQ